MIKLPALRELYLYLDWGNGKAVGLCSGLSDAQLDRPFEMGEGSLRATLYHIWGAERLWLDRWLGRPYQPGDGPDGVSAAELKERFALVRTERDEFLSRQTDESLQEALTYTSTEGRTLTRTYADMLLHVTDHGVHHRAQALNMLRRLGVELPKPGIDYILMRAWEASLPPPVLDVGTIQAYFAYADWARGLVQAAAEKLSDAQLDRPFELGSGSLRHALVHIRDAEQWWLKNWLYGPQQVFPIDRPKLPLAELRSSCEDVADQRKRFLAGLSNNDLLRPVEAQPRAGVTRAFLLGVTLLQLCCHGSHHRAQALNMLRHVGGDVPALGYITWAEQRDA